MLNALKQLVKTYGLPVAERAVRGAIAALVGVYLAGNVIFDVTNISGSLAHLGSIAFGGALSAFGLSIVSGVITKNGPALNKSEVVKKT